MENERKITVMGVIQEGIGVGLKNSLSLLGAIVLWILTIWIPYINVGTTIAIYTIPVALSKGKVISPTFIFDAKYRQYILHNHRLNDDVHFSCYALYGNSGIRYCNRMVTGYLYYAG